MRAALFFMLLLAACHSTAKPDDAGAEASVDAAAEAAVATDVPDADVDATAPLDAAVVPTPVTKKKTPEPPICAQARDAKTRHSPITAQLDAACRAAGGNPDGPAPASTPVPTTSARSSAAAALCAQARDARRRASPIAAQLEAQCRAAGGTP